MSDEKMYTLSPETEDKSPDQVRFIYQKARHHRTFHADGVWAAVTPQSEVQCAFYNNLAPMPDEVTHAINAEGGLGEVLSQERGQAIVREANVTVVMNAEIIKSLIALLAKMVETIESRVDKPTEDVGSEATTEAS